MAYYEQVLATTSASYYTILHLKSYLIACVCPTDKWQPAFTGCTTRVTQYGSAVWFVPLDYSWLSSTAGARFIDQAPLSEPSADGNHCLTWPSYSPQQHDPIKPPPARWSVYSMKENLSASKNYVSSCLRAQTIGILRVKKTIWMGVRVQRIMQWISGCHVLQNKLYRGKSNVTQFACFVICRPTKCWMMTVGYFLKFVDVLSWKGR